MRNLCETIKKYTKSMHTVYFFFFWRVKRTLNSIPWNLYHFCRKILKQKSHVDIWIDVFWLHSLSLSLFFFLFHCAVSFLINLKVLNKSGVWHQRVILLGPTDFFFLENWSRVGLPAIAYKFISMLKSLRGETENAVRKDYQFYADLSMVCGTLERESLIPR